MAGNRWTKHGGGSGRESRLEQYEVNPVTGDRLYTDEEREFLAAAEAYRQAQGKKFLAATDYLRVLLDLGYRKG